MDIDLPCDNDCGHLSSTHNWDSGSIEAPCTKCPCKEYFAIEDCWVGGFELGEDD